MKNTFDLRLFNQMPVVGILRNYSFDEIEFIAPIYQEAGLTTLEITMNSAAAEEEIKYLSSNFPGLNIGAGTVCTLADLDQAEKAGASFIVSPILDVRLIREANRKNLAVFPGAFSPTEIYQAWQAGATAVKIFPATMFGPKYVKEIKAPLNDIKLLPTGGVSPNNINDYFENGATGVGMGSSLFNKKFLQARDKEGLLSGFREIVELVGRSVSP
ncbi:MAG: bifunctional 4-hydroxy-2-oxoglutarate aldolase/2-dehydro-3-deoxy-phosphogluconate aldolase [Saprospiraceae bacterium]|nr:bifunctional 4-hydroxy-2-oxoglutarate aldolase/2-dehydro-3-deoxy-phosphogluconate aldolase [Saprospiraceae bacterium]